jgi:phage antirepressor YoqD-like protein
LIDLEDAAPRLAIPVRRLREYVREGKVQHRRRDGRYQMLWPDDFDAYVLSLLEPVR